MYYIFDDEKVHTTHKNKDLFIEIIVQWHKFRVIS